MKLFKKIGTGLKKFGSFVGKVTKGVAEGGVLGGAAAFVKNVGSGKSSNSKAVQKLALASSSKSTGAQTVGNNTLGGVVLTTKEKMTKTILMWVGIGLAVAVSLFFIFKRKR